MPPTASEFPEAGGGDSDFDSNYPEFGHEESARGRPPRGRWSGSRWLSRLARAIDGASAYVWLIDDQREIAYVSSDLAGRLYDVALANGFEGSPESLLDGLIGRPAVTTSDSENADVFARLASALAIPPGCEGDFTTGSHRWQSNPVIAGSSDRASSDRECRVCFIPLDRPAHADQPSSERRTSTSVLAIVLGRSPDSSAEQLDRIDVQSLWQQLRRITSGLSDMPSMVAVGQTSASRRIQHRLDRVAGQRGNVLLRGRRGFGALSLMRWLHSQWAETSLRVAKSLPPPCVHLDGPLMDVELLEALSAPAVNPLQSGNVPWATLVITEIDRMPLDAQMRLHAIQQSVSDANQDGNRQLYLVASIHTQETLTTAGHREHDSIDSSIQASHSGLCDPLADLLVSEVVEVSDISERLEDLPMIVLAILQQLRRDSSLDAERFSRDALDAMLAYPWPGQFDEVYDVVRSSSYAAGSSHAVQREHLPLAVRTYRASPETGRHEIELIGTLDDALQRFEGYWIEEMMRRTNGNRAEAARLLGISRSRLIRKLDDSQ